MIKMNTFIADELENKVYHLTKALNQAQNIVKILESENFYLKQCLEKVVDELELVSV